MDQQHSRQPSGTTPIYDRLLAEWQAAHTAPVPAPGAPSGPARAAGFVPAARTPDRPAGRG
ncbi:hypothetical protein MHW47_21015 [Streptomyces sp. OfavH-34-F]|uniref:hypothetical protein n=1 Tax=unclassified Streptomyces TaxID=2593676 RepID=UPI001EF161D8|nr:hypothetical protein [Streptomyces sp. OfavH-34-F]MCG7526917.1 hypothetical protein [Streptomyces sp. OfavH-34-F]